MMKNRCGWCSESDMYEYYHDNEWGTPVLEDEKHFEYLILESAQAGLKFSLILKKRDNYRKAYDNFEFENIALYNEKKIAELLNNPGIIRNKLKILASINNAKQFIKIRKEFGSFNEYIWGFTNNRTLINKWKKSEEIPASTKLSDEITKDLKKRGFKFIGSKIIYSYMQAAGIVNDHIISCYRYKELLGRIYE